MTALEDQQALLRGAQTALERARAKRQKWSRREAQVLQNIARAEAEIRRLAYPREPRVGVGDGVVVRFKKRYNTFRVYHYAAVRGGGRWFVTGDRAPSNLTWEQLVDFARLNNTLLQPTVEPMLTESEAEVPF